MAFEMRLLEVIANRDVEAARKLIVPWQRGKFPHPSVLTSPHLGNDAYLNIANYGNYIHPEDYISEEQPELGDVIFDMTGEFQHTGLPDEDEARNNGLVKLLIGIVPPQSVWNSMEGRPIPGKGCGIVLPLQFIYMAMFGRDLLDVVVPQLSGRMPVSEGKPIIYYVKPTEGGKDAIGMFVPYKYMVELPEMFTVSLS